MASRRQQGDFHARYAFKKCASLKPIRDPQPVHASELAFVVGHESESKSKRVAGYLKRAISQFGCSDDARANVAFAHCSDVARAIALWISNEIRDDIRIKKEAHVRSQPAGEACLGLAETSLLKV